MLPTIRKSNSLLNNIFNDWYNVDNTFPAINVLEEDNEYKIEVVAPNLSKEDFKLEVENDILNISYEKKDSKESKNKNYLRREFYYSSLNRSFYLPEGTNIDDIKANHTNGVLNITILKKDSKPIKKSKTISIT